MKGDWETDDQTTLTEITILADGRVFVFGTSAAVVAALAGLCPNDTDLQRRAAHLRAVTNGTGERRIACRQATVETRSIAPRN